MNATPGESSTHDRPAGEGQDPDWLRAAFAQFRDEIALYVRTGWACTRAPFAFAQRFRSGELDAMPPLTFFATSLGLITLVNQRGLQWAGLPQQGTFWQELAVQALAYAKYVLIALIAHPLMRVCGSQRKLRSTLAIALYSGGGPSAWMGILVALPSLFLVRGYGELQLHSWAEFRHLAPSLQWESAGLVVLALASMLVYLVAFARGLAGLHAVRTWKTVGALVVGLVVADVVVTSAQMRFVANSPGAGIHVGVSRSN